MLRLGQDSLLILFLILVVLASGADILTDMSQGVSIGHLIQEAIILILATSFLVWLIYQLTLKQHQLLQLKQSLADIENLPTPASPEVASARHQLGQAILTQFEQWQLTQSEQEVGLLLLKGYSFKEIALLRGTAEKTIRQQASTIYQKSGVSGRHTFSAWFIEDLL